MNKRQKKKKGLLLIEKIYSNWGSKKNKSIEKKEVEAAPIEEVVEEVKVEEAPVEAVKEEKEVKEEDK